MKLAHFGNVLTSIALLVTVSSTRGAVFEGLGFLPGDTESYAKAVSPGGAWIVGESLDRTGGYPTAVRWSPAAGIESLDTFSGHAGSAPYDITASGELIVGTSFDRDEHFLAVTWNQDGGIVPLGIGFGTGAAGVSADGRVIAGATADDDNIGEAFRWTAEDGMVGLGFLDLPNYRGFSTSASADISADGSVIVGRSNGVAFRWDEASGMSSLGWLPHPSGHESRNSHALAVSADGKVVVGLSNDQAFRWTRSTGMVPLELLHGGIGTGWARDLSADGSLTVGISPSPTGNVAVFWDSEGGIHSLQEMLATEYGLDLSGWQLRAALAISADGRVIVGAGVNPAGQVEAWRALLGQIGDTNDDGRVDMTDLNNVRNGFAGLGLDDGTLPGDAFPFDGIVSVDDLNAVRNNFGAGVAAVPEPASVCVLGVGAIAFTLMARRRKRRPC